MMKAILLCVILLCSGCDGCKVKTHRDNLNDVKDEGRRAYRVGIPANANPHFDNRSYAQEWFLGYLEEAEKAKDTAK